MNRGTWAGLDGPLAQHVHEQSQRCLAAYRENPLLVAQDAAIEISTAEGGYGRKQLYELIQNGADALVGRSGRISVVLTNETLYCANEGAPVTSEGVNALMTSHLSVKRGAEIGRFGLGFKSVVGITATPEIFSRSGSFRFDRAAARERIARIVPDAPKYPTLRLAEPLDPAVEAARDQILAGFMSWADTIVKLSLLPDTDWVGRDVADFPSEFLLFSPHVQRLELRHPEQGFEKEVRTSTGPGGAVVLEEGGRRTAYRVFRRVHRPSAKAQRDAGEQARREEIPLVWAVPDRSRGRLGSFWAFFPTASQTTLSGIVNAPWKTNEDRHDLLEGDFNEEILTEVLPRMVADALHSLQDADDPGSFLDILPARGREQRSWADGIINQAVFSAVARVPCLPNSDGALRSAGGLKLHPRDLRPEWLESWAECPTRPADWVHLSVDRNNERRLKVERLVEQARRGPKTLAQWLEALTDDGYLVGSATAITLAAQIIAEAPELETEVRAAAVALTSVDKASALVHGALFLPTPGLEDSDDLTFVHPDLLAFPGVEEALIELGIVQVDQSGLLRALTRQDHSSWRDPQWSRFWTISRTIEAEVAANLLRDELGPRISQLRVRSLNASWQPLGSCFLPGQVVPLDGSRDASHGVDVNWHHDDRALIQHLGVATGPQPQPDPDAEDWYQDYVDWATDVYLQALPPRGSRPAQGYLRVKKGSAPAPLGVISALSPEGRVALTRAALDLGAEPSRTVFHASNSRYPEITVEGPATWFLRRHGVVDTAVGPLHVSRALRPEAGVPSEVLPVARATAEEAARLGIRRSVADLDEEEWRKLLLEGAKWEDDERRAVLYAVAAAHTVRPPRLRIRMGQRLADIPSKDVYVVSEQREYDVLAAQTLPVLRAPDDVAAGRLRDAWGLAEGSSLLETDVTFTAAGEVGPLVDRWPPLRMYLPAELESLEFVPCSDIQVSTVTPNGRTSEYGDFVVHENRVHAVLESESHFFQQLSDELGLDLTTGQVDHIVRQTEQHALRAKAAEIKAAHDDDKRLLLAVGEEALRRSLPRLALASLEADGTPVVGSELARVARAVHGISVLSKLRHALANTGLEPPAQWAGSAGARRFVSGLGFHSELAGLPAASRPALLEVDGPAVLPPLHDYQEHVLERTRDLLRGHGSPRGLVSLPTGAGKTRVAVEALVRHVREEGLTGPVIWIAQSDELCEQAVQTWSFVWRATGPSARLNVSRLWGDNEATRVDDGFHLVVAIDDKLNSVRRRQEYAWLADATVVVIDEAHTSISPTYTGLLEWLGRGRARRPRPLIGLTATPFRNTNVIETDRLAARYDRNRLDEGAFAAGDPHVVLQERRILARVRQHRLEGADVRLTDAELAEMQRFRRVPRHLEYRLGANRERNDLIVRSILEQPDDWTMLLFATSVENAETLAAMLAVRGVPAVAISGGTEPAERRYYVEQFRRGEIRVITNYNVLAQGFDAPAVRAVYVTRPTFSPNMYQQMIGRGLRGHFNGGSDEVLIVNLQDNFDRFGERLAFYDFEYLWEDSHRAEGAGRA